MINTYDLHGIKFLDAMEMAESYIGKVRLESREETVRFIVGHGPIRDGLLNLLYNYDIEYNILMSNEGVIEAYIE